MKESIKTKKLAVRTLVLIMVISGCSSQPSFYPPSKEYQQKMDRVVLRVIADTRLSMDVQDEVMVGSEEGAEYAAEEGAKTAGRVGGSIIYVGCHPGMGVLWIFTCPAGLVAGAVVGFGGAIIGIAGGGVYGATQALSEEEIHSAVATIKKAKALFDTELASTFHERFVYATQEYTEVRLIDEPLDVTEGAIADKNDLPFILAVRITGFKLIQTGRLDPDLSLQIFASANLYDMPETGRLYTREWSYLTELGDYYDLTEHDGKGLKQGINAALETVANAMVKDLFPVVPAVTEAEQDNRGNWYTESERSDEKYVAKVETVFTREPVPRNGWFKDQKKKADCGDVEVQLELGRAYAAIDPRIFGWRGRDALIDGYYWLRVAQISGRDDKQIALYLSELEQHLNNDEIMEAEQRAQEWQPVSCSN